MQIFRCWVILCLLIVCSDLLAQSDSLPYKYKRGIYFSFEELLGNAPIYRDSFLLEGTYRRARILYNPFTLSDTKKILVSYITDQEGKKIKGSKDVWGCSTGEKLFVKGLESGSFVQILYIGRYFYFLDYEIKVAGGPQYYGTVEYLQEYIININNGGIFKLTDKLLKEILVRDKEIYNEYIEDDNRIENKAHYIMKYSEKHKDEIKVKHALVF